MPVFDVEVRNGSRVQTLTLVAKDQREAAFLARRDGGTVTGAPRQKKERGGAGMTPGERYVFLHSLATMTMSKFPLSKGLQILRDSHGGRIGRCAAQLEAGVAAGRQIADLMYEDKRNFPGAVGLLVKAGSKASGGTAQALKKAAEFEREILGAQTKGAKGLWSAGFWVTGGAIGTLACPIWLTPYLQSSELFQLTDKPITWNWLDNVAYAFGGIMLLMMLFGLALFFVVMVGQRAFPVTSDMIIMRVPVLKEIIFSRDNFISLYRFALMVKAGVTMEEALETTWKDTRRGALRDDLGRALNNVRRGKPWSEGFRTVHPTDRAALSMASDKESLGIILEQVADQNRAVYIRKLELVQPVLQFIGGFSMVIVYGVSGLYSIVPFAGLFEQLMGSAYGSM